MRVNDLEKIGFKRVTAGDDEVVHGYVGDLLSEVMANAKEKSVWVTVQSHVNVVAVATIVGARAIVLCNGYKFDEKTVEKAEKEGVALFTTRMNSFEATGKLYELGLR